MISVKNIEFSYARGGEKVLNDISFDIEPGQCMAILGNNGVGKSTLLKCMDRIFHSQGGAVIVDGKNVLSLSSRELAQNIAYVPQNQEISDMTVFDMVLLGRKPYIKWDADDHDRQLVRELLEKFSLEKFSMRKMSQLSGGEAQKVSLARALAQEPKFLLLDEPTSNLDMRNQHEVLQMVRELAAEEGISVAIIIHDLNLALRYCDRLLFMKDGRIFSDCTPESISREIIDQVYGMNVVIESIMGHPTVVPV